MSLILTGQHDIQDLFREVILDDGAGNPVVYTTTTAPTITRPSIGVFEQLTTSDVLTTPTETTYSQQIVQDWPVTITESVTMVVIDLPPITGIFDTVANTESVSVFKVGWDISGIVDTVTAVDSLAFEPVPKLSVTDTTIPTDVITLIDLGQYFPALITDSTATTEFSDAHIVS